MTGTDRPYVDYYQANQISPADQDISDRQRHFGRRESLYRLLGIPPRFVRGRDVIEFGPAAGHNALYTLSLEPGRFVLVDAHAESLRRARELLERENRGRTKLSFHEALVEEFVSAEAFDLVLCEGLIPFRSDPAAFARHVAKSVAPGGILVITTHDSASWLGELTRRLICDRLVPFSAPLAERVAAVREIFRPHLATLRGMTRSVDDWILDNIVHPLPGRVFAVDEAVDALDDGFDFYGSSPSFVTDWRWYKDIHGSERRFNERAKSQYVRGIVNLMDLRVEQENEPQLGVRLREMAARLHERSQAIEARPETTCTEVVDLVDDLLELAGAVRPASAITADSLSEVAAFLRSPDPTGACFHTLTSFFGRAQQYVSFIRREDG